ncbi:MAG: DUF5996 family protein [Chloroflexi bacterium]|nr:DUF5996 family protein [Chloroflexota bacterium]MCI0577181.1 DUF5996 family protein [Chloroflexota bacterium]MCI0649251.1 DUF5996 family protein [Chloroflexota bacterium]MCI0730433.1 DUF5996 family protein [Chloroflexota bacterium]
MTQPLFPPLPLAKWKATRDTIQSYAQVVGKVRRAMTPHQKHWSHISLRAATTGLTTTPMWGGDCTFELLLDFVGHQLVLTTSHGEWFEIDFDGQSAREFGEEVLDALDEVGVQPALDLNQFGDKRPAGDYDAEAVETFWQALSQVDQVFKQFKGELREETGPVQLWPHHFDLAVLWFSGRLVPGVDPADEEKADEQMNFGFSTGDEGIPNPYFYATAYPWPDGLEQTPLPAGATWHLTGWKGGLLMYDELVQAANPREKLLEFLRTAQQAGAAKMRYSSSSA